MNLGKRISIQRKNKSMSQETLAEVMGVSRQSVSLWENNQTIPSMEKLLQLSVLLEFSLDEVVGNNDNSLLQEEAPISRAKTKLNIKMIDETIKIVMKQMRITTIVLVSVLTYVTVVFWIDGVNQNNYFPIVTIVLIGVISLRYYSARKKSREIGLKDIDIDPNKMYYFEFYNNHVSISIKSQKTNSNVKIEYKDFNKVYETESYYMLLFNNRYYTIDKNEIKGNKDFLHNVLKSRINLYQSPVEKIDNRSSDISLKKRSILKILSNILFVLCFFTLPLALVIFALFTETQSNYSPVGSVENTWIFLLVLPIPVTSIILGFILKKNAMKGTKNIVVGGIMTGLVLIYSSFSLIFGSMISHDYSYVDGIEEVIEFELPDTGKITIQNYTNSTSTDGTIAKYDSDILFTDTSEITAFENSIKLSSLWTEGIRTQNIGMLSTSASFQKDRFDYFLIYNIDLDTYNELPTSSGFYNIIFIGYNLEDDTMKIMEYNIEITVN